MTRKIAISSTVVLACACLLGNAQPPRPVAPPRPALEVSTWARAFRPGEVVLVTVRTSVPLADIEGLAFEQAIAFWQPAAAAPWTALAAIPLGTTPRAYDITVRAHAEGGPPAVARVSVTVRPGQFEKRQLRVDPRFVDPPASEAPRIAREAKRLAAIFEGARRERLWQGPFVTPVPGASNSAFGRMSIFNGKPRGQHQGADFRAAAGTPVVAPNAGDVVLASDLYFSGNTLVIDHGFGMFSLLAHLSRLSVAEGARVAAGDHLGDSGATGRVTGPHLHWAVRLRHASVDPLSLMAAVDAMAGTPGLAGSAQ